MKIMVGEGVSSLLYTRFYRTHCQEIGVGLELSARADCETPSIGRKGQALTTDSSGLVTHC
jgi:hypothetical protein